MKILILIVFAVILLASLFAQNDDKKPGIIVLILVGGVITEVFAGYISDAIRPILFDTGPPAAGNEIAEPARGEDRQPDAQAPGTEIADGGESSSAPPPESEAEAPAPESEAEAPAPEPEPESPAPDPEPDPSAPEPEADPLSLLEDITGQTSFSGSVVEKGQTNQYRYTAPTDGTYCFDTGLDYGVVSLRIDNAYGGKLSSSSISASPDLEAGKTYIVSVTYGSRPSDYTVQIGVPNPVTDITGQTSVSGSLTYLTQADRYTYTAPVSGTYLFDADGLNFNALFLEILNAQGGRAASGSPTATAALEAGKVYTLCVEATVHLLDYTLQIHVPNPPADISAASAASGTLTFAGQRDQYYYTPPADGTYCFDTGTRYGGVSMAVRDAGGSSCGVSANVLTVPLKAGTQYVLEVYKEYASLPVEYSISIAAQQES